jgi:hypothetical protein
MTETYTPDPETGIEGGLLGSWGIPMANMFDAVIESVDPEGKTCTNILHLSVASPSEIVLAQTFATVNQVVQDWAKMSGAQVRRVSYVWRVFVSGEKPTQNEAQGYDNIEDKALIEAYLTNGKVLRTSVPMPLAGIFKADGETVDPASVPVAAFMTDCITGAVGPGVTVTVVGPDGDTVDSYYSGTYKRSKAAKRHHAGISTELGGQ